MANGQYNYNIKVKASADRASFDSVKKSLSEITSMLDSSRVALEADARKNGSTTTLVKQINDIKSLTAEVQKFQHAFNQSFNENLGAINLTHFNDAIKKSQVDLQKVANAFARGGDSGKKAFRELSAEILSTNRNLEKTTTFIDNMATTMGNTIKWGISSSIMNSFTGSVEKAYGYVKNLDKSLNNIRIVGEQSAEQMASFAKYANEASKALGATTLDYTDAALIYYQQGLNDDQVQQMTDITVKMSNVLGSSADEVSNYMTAIWNNFADGSKSLEYYADVITKLGAATASSAEEIADGLEKFAAIADTVGLSYEYATAALTTVTAQTRQSADVVGTAFKTLFARIQDLELGETLDDGTTLGKYSEALNKVGISIKDSSGEMREMDDILKDMGEKWDSLTKAQQTSLAQTVAGTRQYTQLVALMDNWDKFQENLQTAASATGSLDEQQSIYLDSVEAHLNGMQASFEGLYDSILDEDTIKGFADAMSAVAKTMSTLVNGLGGGGNALLTLGSIATTVFSKNIAQGLTKVAVNMRNTKDNAAILNAELEIMEKFKGLKFDDSVTKHLIQMKKDVLEYGHLVTDEQQNEVDAIINTTAQLANQKEEWLALVEEVRKFAIEKKGLSGEEAENYNLVTTATANNQGEATAEEKDTVTANLNELQEKLIKTKESLEDNKKSALSFATQVNDYIEKVSMVTSEGATKETQDSILKELDNLQSSITGKVEELINADQLLSKDELEKLKNRVDDVKTAMIVLEDAKQNSSSSKELASKTENAIWSLDSLTKAYQETVKGIEQSNPAKMLAVVEGELASNTQSLNNKINETDANFSRLKDTLETTKTIENVTKLAGSFGQVASGVLSLINLTDIWNNQDLSTGEKFLQIISALSTSVPMVISGFSTLISSGKEIIKVFPTIAAQIVAIAAARKEQAKANTMAATSEVVLATGETVAGVAAGGATVTTSALAGAVWTLLAPLLPVIAAVGALAVGLYALTKAYNADADAAKKAAEYSAQAGEEADKARQQYENLVATFDKYQEGVDALKTLDQTTEEYRQTLEETNKAALELIKTDASLAKYVTKGQGGVIEFRDEQGNDVSEKIKNQAKAKANSAAANANIAQIRSNEAQLKASRTNARRESDLNREDKVTELYIKQSLSPLMLIPNILSTELQNSLTDNQMDEVIQTIIDNNGMLTRESLEQLSFLNNAEIDALMENKTSLEQLAKSTDQLNETNKLLVEESLRNSLENNEDFSGLSDPQKNAVTALYGDKLTDEKRKELTKAAEEEWYQDKAFGGGNEDDVHLAYAEAKGYTLMDDKLGDKAVYYDPTTDETVTIDDDSAREFLINKDVQEGLADYDTNYRDKIIGAVESVDTSKLDSKYGADFSTMLFNAVASDSKKLDLTNMFAEINPAEMEELSKMTPDEWRQSLGLTDEELKTLGLGSGEEFAKNWKEAMASYEWDIDKALKASIGKLDEEDTADLDSEDLEEYAKNLMVTAEESEKLADTLTYDSDAAAMVAAQVMKMNKGVEDLAKGFENWNDVLKNSSKESQEYADALGGIKNALSDIFDVSSDYISNDFVEEHLDEIKEAANGSEKAINSLKSKLTEDIILNLVTYNDMEENKDEVLKQVQDLQTKLDSIQVGKTIDLNADDSQVIDMMNNIIEQAGLTAEQANELFSQMGIEPEFETTQEEQNVSVPEYTTETEVVKRGFFGTPTVTKTRTWQTGSKTMKQMVDVPALSVNGSPKVVKITRKAGSSFNNYSSINKGGPSAGGGSKSEPSKKDFNTDEKDPYQKVNAQLKTISNTLKKIEGQEEKLTGADLINNLNKQLKVLNQQIDKTREKMSIALNEKEKLQRKLSQYGIGFDEDGNIANYAAVYDQQQQALNAVYARYNSMSKDAQENYEDTVKAAEKKWEEFTESINEYDTIVGDTIPGLEEEIEDMINRQFEIQIQQFNMEITIGLDLAEAKEEWSEFKKNILDDIQDEDILGLANHNLSRISTYLDENQNGILQTETKQLTKLLDELKLMDSGSASNIYGTNKQQALDDLKTYYTQAMADMEALKEITEEIENSLLDMMEHVEEQMSEQLAAYQMISDTLDHDMNLIKLISGEQSYSELDNYFAQKEQNLNSQLDFQRQQVELWQQQMATLEEGTEAWEIAKENWTSAVSEWQSSVTLAIENLQEKYANAIQNIFATINNEITNGKGLEYINQEWELINKNADEYLDTINAQYGIQSLQNKYLKSIEETDNLSAQRKLRDLMNEQVEALEAQDKLSEYDLERAELKYQIALKQIALEEAQQSKTSMRLRRDSQGNYSYQYTSDNEQTADLEDELSKLYNDLYNLDKGQYTNNLDTIYNLWVEYQQKMAEAAQINDPEARLEREKLLTEYYSELLNDLALDNTDIRTNLSESAFMAVQELFEESYANQEDLVMNQLVPLWDSGVQEMINLFAGEGGFDQVCTEAYNQIEQAAVSYESSLQTLLETAGVTYDKIKTGQDKVIETTKTLIKDNNDLMTSYNQEIEAIKGVIGTLGDLTDKYKESEVAAKAATQAAYEYWAEQQRQQQEAAAKNDPNKNKVGGDKTTENPTTGSTGGSGTGSGTSSGPQGNGTPDVGDVVTYTGGYYYGDSYGGGGKGRRGVGKQVQITRINNGAPYPIHVYSKDSAYGWLKKEQLSGFDTGGYTGNWNTEDGRLALLHQKELVLNATDTENMLNAVNALRNITDSMGAMMLGRLANITAPGVGNIEDGTLEQNVHIDASFPNVTSSQEIENALNNLVNAATQHIHSKK